MIVYHGSTSWKVHSLASGKSRNWFGLYVTDTAERAQLYADAQASGKVSTTPRYCKSSAVAELEIEREITWSRRPDDHPTLDKCEAVIETWMVRKVIVRMSEYDAKLAKVKVNGRYVSILENLQQAFGDKLELIIIE